MASPRTLRVEYQPLDAVKPARRNPKGHDLDTIRASIERHGLGDVAGIVNESTGRLVAGHGRLTVLAAMHLEGVKPPAGVNVDGETWLVPLLYGTRWKNQNEAEAFLIGHNRTTELGGWDRAELAVTLTELDDLRGTGYTLDDIDPEPEPDRGDVDDQPPPPAAPLTRLGDLWQIGPHRLVCGSSHDPDVWTRLLENDPPVALAVTSPPYADRRKYDETTDFRPIPPDEYVDWFQPVAENVAAHLADDGSWLVNIKAGADGLDRDLYVADLLIAHVRRWGWHYADEFAWERNGVPKQPVQRLKNQFEPVFQFTRGRWKFRPDNVRHATTDALIPFGPGRGNTSWADPDSAVVSQGQRGDVFAGQRARKRKHGRPGAGATEDAQGSGHNDVGEYKVEGLAYPGNRLPTFSGTHEATGHGAAYPVGLPAFLAKLYTDEGDVMVDPFTGSGSSILAADQTTRIGRGIELSPAYVDVALARLQHHTGHTPTRNGKAHDMLAHTGWVPARSKATEPTS